MTEPQTYNGETTLYVRLDQTTMEMIEAVRVDLNLKQISEAVRVLIKKGYDTHVRQLAIMSNTL